MKNRFPTAHRATWRSRFVAIARQAEAAGRPGVAEGLPRRPVDGAQRTAIRVRFAAISSGV
jgi:hypothetical protein